MRTVKTIADVQIVLNELLDFKAKLLTKSWDLRGLRITNAGASVNPSDYVIQSELQQFVSAKVPQDQYYTQVFSVSSAPADGEFSPPFVVQAGREGYPYFAWVAAINAPSSAICKVNIQLAGTNILSSDLQLPIGAQGPVSSAQFINPKPKIGTKAFMNAVVNKAGGVSLLSIGLVIQVA